MSKKEELQKYIDMPTLPTSSPAKSVIVTSEISKAYNRIKENLKQYQDVKIDIIKDMRFLQEHQDELKAEKGITFQEFIENELGMSKQYFYEQLRAFNVCLEFNDPEKFNEVDYRKLVKVSRILDLKERKKLFMNIDKLTRDDFKSKSDLLPPKKVNFESLIKHNQLDKFILELRKFFERSYYGDYKNYNISNQDDAKIALIEYIEKKLPEWK